MFSRPVQRKRIIYSASREVGALSIQQPICCHDVAVYQGRIGDTADFSLFTVYSSSSCISGQDRIYRRFLSVYTVYSSSSCISGYWRRYSRFLSVYCILQFQLYIRVGSRRFLSVYYILQFQLYIRVQDVTQQISLCILYTLVLAVYQGIGGEIADFSLYTVYSSSICISGYRRRYSRFLSVYCIYFSSSSISGQDREMQKISLCIIYN